jgi:hypothetical protein
MRLVRIMLAAGALLALSGGTVSAGVPSQVDQGALQPPLNQQFTYRCFANGPGILCQGTYDPSWTNDDTGLTCDGQPIYTTGGGHERLTRWHDADGRALHTAVQLRYEEAWSLSPEGAGPTVTLRGDWNRLYDYPVPGSLQDRVLTEVGSSWIATAAGSGVIAHDAGLITYLPGRDFDEASVLRGPKDFWGNFDAAISDICLVLAG